MGSTEKVDFGETLTTTRLIPPATFFLPVVKAQVQRNRNRNGEQDYTKHKPLSYYQLISVVQISNDIIKLAYDGRDYSQSSESVNDSMS